MTYWGYHLLFTLPVIALLAWTTRHRWTRLPVALSILAVALIAFLFTTPWDNYAVALGIWGFGEDVSLGYPLSHLADQTPWLGWIPVEEYSFFVLESVLVCLVCLHFLPHRRESGA